jgi:hypothetical protein
LLCFQLGPKNRRQLPQKTNSQQGKEDHISFLAIARKNTWIQQGLLLRYSKRSTTDYNWTNSSSNQAVLKSKTSRRVGGKVGIMTTTRGCSDGRGSHQHKEERQQQGRMWQVQPNSNSS